MTGAELERNFIGGLVLHLLFVCTGNICRSPIAERLSISYAERSNFDDFRVSSAGTHALAGHPIHPYAARAIEQQGGDPSRFAARQLTPTIAADADLVVTMTGAHRGDVLKLAPRQLHRTFTLHETARLVTECNARNVADLSAFRSRLTGRGLSDVLDPIGRDEAFFATVTKQIAGLLPPVLEICRVANPAR
jgi:protein-tyrosine phosphatase